MVSWETLLSLVHIDQWNSQYDSLSLHNLAFTYNTLKSWNGTLSNWNFEALSQEFYTLLTHWMVNIEISSTVPVCCVTVEYDVTLFPVEHKKVRIRHSLLCVKLQTAQVFWRFHTFCLRIPKTWKIQYRVKINVNIYVFTLRNTCDMHI
jgi:hypothetical protein